MGPILGSPYFGKVPYRGYIGLYRDNGKEHGNYYSGSSHQGCGKLGWNVEGLRAREGTRLREFVRQLAYRFFMSCCGAQTLPLEFGWYTDWRESATLCPSVTVYCLATR